MANQTVHAPGVGVSVPRDAEMVPFIRFPSSRSAVRASKPTVAVGNDAHCLGVPHAAGIDDEICCCDRKIVAVVRRSRSATGSVPVSAVPVTAEVRESVEGPPLASAHVMPSHESPYPRRVVKGCPEYGGHGCMPAVRFQAPASVALRGSSATRMSVRMSSIDRSRPSDVPYRPSPVYAPLRVTPAGSGPYSAGLKATETAVNERKPGGMVPSSCGGEGSGRSQTG